MLEKSEGCLLVDGMADTNTRDTLVGLAKEGLGPEGFIPFFAKLDELSDVEADHFLVSQCSEQMATKLALSRAKGRGGWHTPGCSIEHLRSLLKGHLEKGDMVDVLNFAGMILVREQQDRSLQHEPVIGCSHSVIDLCTTDAHPCRNIHQVIGVVTVRNQSKYGTFLNDRQGEDTLEMLAGHAAGLGASGVVGVRMNHIGDVMSAYGTAVIFE